MIFLPLLSLCFCLSLSQPLLIRGAGSDSTLNLINSWLYDYQLQKPLDLVYTLADDGTAVETLQAGEADFLGVEAPINVVNTAVLPICTQPLVFQVNIPELPQNETLILGRQTLADIYCNAVNNWRDPAILFANPLLQDVLPNATIHVVVDVDESDEIQRTSSLFVQWSSIFNATVGQISSFPPNLTNLSNWHLTDDVRDQFATIILTDYSIGVIDLSLVKAGQEQYVRLINIAGNVVGVDPENLEVSTGGKLEGFVGDSPLPMAYPFVEIFFWVLPTKFQNQAECSKYREFFKFIHWCLNDPLARNRIISNGFGPLGPDLLATATSILNSITCNGEVLAAFQDQRTLGSGFFVSCALAGVVLLFVLILSGIHTYYFRSNRIHLSYSLALVLGSIITFMAPLFWFTKPTRDSICLSRVWLTSLGMVILLASMFSRTWQLQAIYRMDKKRNMKELRQLNVFSNAILKLILALSVFVIVDVVILVAWTVTDPYQATFTLTDELELLGNWTCTSRHLATWLSLQIGLVLSMIIFGIGVIYQTWTFSKQVVVNETRYVLMALYDIVLVIAVLIPFLSLGPLDDSSLSIVMGVGIDFSALGIIFAVLLPRVVKNVLYGSSKDSHSDGSKPGSKTHTNSPLRPTTPTQSHNAIGVTGLSQLTAVSLSPNAEMEILKSIEEPLKGPSTMDESERAAASTPDLNPDLVMSSHGTRPLLDASVPGVIEEDHAHEQEVEVMEVSNRSQQKGISRLEDEPEKLNDPEGAPIFNPFRSSK